MNSALIEQWKRIRRASVPLVCFESADQIATAREIVRLTNGAGPACMSWDIARGLQPLNDNAGAVCNELCDGEDPAITTGNPAECLAKLQRLERRDSRDIVIMYNMHLCFDVPAVLQGVTNLRDMFKQNGHTLVLMGPAISVPIEIAQDIMLVSDVLPDVVQIQEIIRSTVRDAGGAVPEDIDKVADTLIGLSVFSAEQTLATCIYKDEAGAVSIDREALWDRKCKVIEQTKGLSVLKGPERFADLMDLDNLTDYLTSLVSDYSCIVFVDEIEKAFGGAQGDNTGVKQDIHGVWLQWLQDNEETDGIILIGHPGTGKSAVAKAARNAAGIPGIQLDVNGMLDSKVGASGTNTRGAFRVVDAISGGKTLVLATCNSIEALSPELKRRFTLGTFFVDLPTEQGRVAMWGYYAGRYDVLNVHTFSDEGWTGAEIKQCCRLAKKLRCDVDKAATFIVPVCRSSAERIEQLRGQASGKFISASKPGIYQKGVAGSGAGRKFNL